MVSVISTEVTIRNAKRDIEVKTKAFVDSDFAGEILVPKDIARELRLHFASPDVDWTLRGNSFRGRCTYVDLRIEDSGFRAAKAAKAPKGHEEGVVISNEIYTQAYLYKDYVEKMLVIENLDRLCLDLNKTEGDYKLPLKENPWIFGPYYVDVWAEEEIVLGINDFLLKRVDGLFDFVEVKKPIPKLFVDKGKRGKWGMELKNAVSQVMHYLTEYDKLDMAKSYIDKYYRGIDTTKEGVFLPSGIILIGRRNEDETQLLQIHNAHLNRITIITYDDLIDCAKNSLMVKIPIRQP
jgi:hypothetical protein